MKQPLQQAVRQCEDHCIPDGSYLRPRLKLTGAASTPSFHALYLGERLLCPRTRFLLEDHRSSKYRGSMVLSCINFDVYIWIEKR